MEKLYLDCSYDHKHYVKACGAQFDWDVKRWYTTPEKKHLFRHFLRREKLYLRCPYAQREKCKAKGGSWDREAKRWYIYLARQDPTEFEEWLSSSKFEHGMNAYTNREREIALMLSYGREWINYINSTEQIETQPNVVNDNATEEDTAGNECVVCMDDASTFAAVPCGHRCLCGNCVQAYQDNLSQSCPICRVQPTAWIRIF